MHTGINGIFACGNVLHVHDIVDFVSKESRIAGKNAALFALHKQLPSKTVNCKALNGIRYIMPNKVLTDDPDGVNLFMRTDAIYTDAAVTVKSAGTVLAKKKIKRMVPSEMISIPLSFKALKNISEEITAEVE